MKNLSLSRTKFWVILHVLLLTFLVVSGLCGRQFRINTNLFDILPDSSSLKAAGKAEKKLSEKNGRNFFILCGADSFRTAKSLAAALFDELNTSDGEPQLFEALSLGEENSVSEIVEFFHEWRFNLNDSATTSALLSGACEDAAQEIAGEALDEAYSGMSIVPLEMLETDPFLLSSRAMGGLLEKLSKSGTAMTMRDGVLSTEFQGKHYVLLRGILSKAGSSISNKTSGVKKIYEAASSVRSRFDEADGVKFVYSGVPFHSYKSSSNAQKEITIISVVSILLVILLFVYIFRSAIPLIASVLAIGVSAVTALCSVLLVFGEIHILTFVFGTTLIGTCLDYSLHFFVRWKGDSSVTDGEEIRQKLFRGLSFSLFSTLLCYLVLTFLPFVLLKQIAVFSLTGILSSYLSVVCIYPELKVPSKGREIFCLEKISSAEKILNRKKSFRKIFSVSLICVSVFTFVIFINNVRIENNLRSFYSMSGKLLDDEILSAKILNHGSSGWYFILKAASRDEILELEENFSRRLEEEIKNGNLGSYNCVSQYIPSRKNQELSWISCGEYLMSLAEEQFLNLGFGREEYENYVLAYSNAYGKVLYPDGNIPSFLKSALSNLWIGQIDGSWYSAVMPLHAENVKVFEKLASETSGVFFVNKMDDVEKELNGLTRLMLAMIFVAWLILIPLLYKFYGRKALRMILLPLMIVLITVASLAAFDVPLGFFSVTGIILIFGLGMDYIIYSAESRESLNGFAILLSFLTTAISFGALAFSSFMPVKMFGLTVFAGLVASFICARISLDI